MKTTTVINTLISLATLVLAILILVKYEKKEKYELQSKNANCKCSGHGTCDTSTGKCKCLPGWAKFDCHVSASSLKNRKSQLPQNWQFWDKYWEELLLLCPRLVDMPPEDFGFLINDASQEISTSMNRNCAPDLYSVVQKYRPACYSCK